jgi:hypothetical protein
MWGVDALRVSSVMYKRSVGQGSAIHVSSKVWSKKRHSKSVCLLYPCIGMHAYACVCMCMHVYAWVYRSTYMHIEVNEYQDVWRCTHTHPACILPWIQGGIHNMYPKKWHRHCGQDMSSSSSSMSLSLEREREAQISNTIATHWQHPYCLRKRERASESWKCL